MMRSMGKAMCKLVASAVLIGLAASGAAFAAVSTGVVGYNHMARGIGYFTVKIDDGKPVTAGYLGAGSGGGGKTCCLLLPDWHGGLKVKVISQQETGGKLEMMEQLVPVPRWDPARTSNLNVHFLANGKIKVFVAASGLGSEDYPLQGKEALLKRPSANGQASTPGTLAALVTHVRNVIPDETNQVPKEALNRFVERYQKRAAAAGITDIDLQTQYVLLALYTSGAGVEHPLCVKLMNKPPKDLQAFHDAMQALPQAVWDAGPPLWEAAGNVKQ